MSDIAIRVENLSKAYQLGDFGTGTLSRDIERWWALLRGKEDPFLTVGETNDRTSKGDSDIVWSLKDINFDINQGDAVGIIGRNGAGKSTLLKVLSRVTSPTTGNIKVKGRIASLLEVGTGFHPELTGGENIYLNGAIMGMSKREIKKKFDEIVDFAGVERYVDTPVKRYSSGMYVRLAFAVAAHLESEILIVDEVLAVGDAEFQKKCLGKMGDVSKGEGRTVLFVSHNMDSISRLCKHCIFLKNGELVKIGETRNVINDYVSFKETIKPRELQSYIKPTITHAELDLPLLLTGTLACTINFFSPFELENVNVGFIVKTQLGNAVFGTNCRMHPPLFDENYIKAGKGTATLEITDLPLYTGSYSISLYLGDGLVDYDEKIDYLYFDYISPDASIISYDINVIGPLRLEGKWHLQSN